MLATASLPVGVISSFRMYVAQYMFSEMIKRYLLFEQ